MSSGLDWKIGLHRLETNFARHRYFSFIIPNSLPGWPAALSATFSCKLNRWGRRKKQKINSARARDSLWPKGILKISRAIDLWAKTTTKVIYQLIDILDSSLFILKKKNLSKWRRNRLRRGNITGSCARGSSIFSSRPARLSETTWGQ